MSKALCSMNQSERTAAVGRRIKEETGGLGYLAARDYLDRAMKGTLKKSKYYQEAVAAVASAEVETEQAA